MKREAYGDYVVGLMSGTSLDGLDICLAWFCLERGSFFSHRMEKTVTIPYPTEWIEKLKKAEQCVGAELYDLHQEYGNYLGERVNEFLLDIPEDKKPEIISSHGHTIYHRPEAGYTFQLGDGFSLAKTTGITTICDFRSGDVALGGQGAPLVPIGDKLLFPNHEFCLNLGGFANISFEKNSKRIAFDICPANYVLNRLAQRLGKEFDKNGNDSATGKLIPELLEKLNFLSFYKKTSPKSLGREWVEQVIFPLLDEKNKTADLLRTFTEHIADQIAIQCNSEGKMLVTGGGAFNSFLISRLKEKCKAEIVIPDKDIVSFKEAYVFAFLGWMRWYDRVNILSSVTGAKEDSSGGNIVRVVRNTKSS